MKILDSSSNQKIDLTEKEITIYNCGPTVYNYVHIGNVRPLVVFDVLHRFLLALGKEVKYIQNITDVDDKIIKAAKEQNISEKELTEKYIEAYLNVFKILNIKKVKMPKVSEHINDIIKYIRKLIYNNAAYVVDGDVYFDIDACPNYGHISHQNIDELLNGVRKENKTNKASPLDFVLWKQTNEGINWDSPWSRGRPGWHTECCVLINKYIGERVTIHGGGVDLKFPHHENENAQNYALYKHDLADVWMHIGHVNVEGAKMSKSLGNFILVNDLINENNANGLRWLFYKSKYQQPINYSASLFEEAIKEVNNLIYNMSIVKTHLIANGFWKVLNYQLKNNFIECLSDDLNLPNAITIVLNNAKDLNKLIREKKYMSADIILNEIYHELDVLGIVYDKFNHEEHLSTILNWKKAIDAKDYTQADLLRKELINNKLL